MAWINNLCEQYNSSYARDDNPREWFINSCTWNNNPCAWYNNPWARYNNPYSWNNNPFSRYNNPWARNDNMSSRFSIRANGIRIHALDIINRTHEIIIRFHDIIIWAHNLTIYLNWLVYSSDSITKEPNGHVSLTWVYVFLYDMYLLETGKAPCWHTRIQVRQITFVYTIFEEGHQKQFLPKWLWILFNNLIGLSYMKILRSSVGQSREEEKDQELVHDDARHCPVWCLGFEYRGSATVNFNCKELSWLAVGDKIVSLRSVRFFFNFCSALHCKHSYLSFKCTTHPGIQPFQRRFFQVSLAGISNATWSHTIQIRSS